MAPSINQVPDLLFEGFVWKMGGGGKERFEVCGVSPTAPPGKRLKNIKEKFLMRSN